MGESSSVRVKSSLLKRNQLEKCFFPRSVEGATIHKQVRRRPPFTAFALLPAPSFEPCVAPALQSRSPPSVASELGCVSWPQ